MKPSGIDQRIIECAKAAIEWDKNDPEVRCLAQIGVDPAPEDVARMIQAAIIKWLEQAPSPTQIGYGDAAFARAMKGEASVNAFVTEIYVSMCRGAAKEISS